MSAERYRVTEYQHSGLDFLQIERGGSTHELCAQTDDSMIVGAIRQQSADIAELRAELAAAVAERDEWKECAMSNLDERDQLRAQLAEYENAPTVAVVWFARNKDGVACSGLDYTDLPPIGTELIARKVKK